MPGQAIAELAHVHHGEGFTHTGLHFGTRNAAALQTEGDVLRDRHMRKEGVALKDHPGIAAVRWESRDIALAKEDLPGCDIHEAGKHSQGRGLAAAARAKQGEELAVMDGQIETLNDLDVAVGLADGIEVDCGHLMDRQKERLSLK